MQPGVSALFQVLPGVEERGCLGNAHRIEPGLQATSSNLFSQRPRLDGFQTDGCVVDRWSGQRPWVRVYVVRVDVVRALWSATPKAPQEPRSALAGRSIRVSMLRSPGILFGRNGSSPLVSITASYLWVHDPDHRAA